jgi:hypothetical protein
MNPQDAGELVHLWAIAHDDPESVAQQRGPVSRAIRELAPDGTLRGIGQTPSGPVMLVLLDDALLVFASRPRAALHESSVPVRAKLLRLDAAHADLEVTERWDDARRVHLWQLSSGGMDIRIDGAEMVHAGIEAGHDPNEALGRAIAARLGWTLP